MSVINAVVNPAESNLKSTLTNPTTHERRVSFIGEDGEPVETVVSPTGRFRFARKTGLVDSVRHLGKTIEPAHNLKTLCEKGLVKFPSDVVPYDSDVKLLEEIDAFVRRYANVPQEWREIIALYVLLTWVYDRFTAVPYLRFLGEAGTGKSRLQQICGAICYKAIKASGNITGAALFRTIDLVQGTMIVDEGDFKNSDEWSDITKILNTGYTPDSPIIRCAGGGEDFTPQAFQIYGPKIISTRSRFADDALESRCLTFETREEFLPEYISLQIPLSFEQEAIVLRNKLLCWRFENYQRIRAREAGMRGLLPRSGQIGASLAAVAPTEEWHRKLVDFLRCRDEDRQGDSPKGIVLQAVVELKAERQGGMALVTVADITVKVRFLCTARGLDEMSPRRVGGILRSLGITPRKKRDGYTIDLSTVNVVGERVNVARGEQVHK